MIFSLNTFLGIGFVVSFIAWIIESRKLWTLQYVTLISTSDMAEVMEYLRHEDEIENPAQHLARMAKMDPDEVQREIDLGNTYVIIRKICGQVLDRMKESVPGGNEIVANHRCSFEIGPCKK